jgi:tyrosyl-tRNA synthetase
MTTECKTYIDEDGIPCTEIPISMLPIPAWKLLVITGLCKSGNEARRLIQQGGMYISLKGGKE